MAGNRTRVNCLEGSYAHQYTTIAWRQAIGDFNAAYGGYLKQNTVCSGDFNANAEETSTKYRYVLCKAEFIFLRMTMYRPTDSEGALRHPSFFQNDWADFPLIQWWFFLTAS